MAVNTLAWIYLVVAGLLEVVWAVSLKGTQGFTRFWPSVYTLAAMVASFWLLSVALKTLPTGTGYAVWVGIGAVGTALFGIFVLGEPRNALRLVSIGLIVAGVVGLRLGSGGGH
jgi:quaternary ammonium compound-resistance protein SugE